MRRIIVRWLAGTLALIFLTLGGCGKPKPPSFTEAEGTVMLDGKPLPFAFVEFMPNLPKFGAEYNSSATTDENGHYRLVSGHEQQPGAAIGKHRVVIREAPAPQDMRGMDGDSQERYARYVAGLKNRPIPENYGTAATTPLSVEVTADKKTYDFQLTR